MLLPGALLVLSAGAADPWGRPGHLRAVAEPVAAWEELDRRRERIRLWWDEGLGPAEVQALRRGRWRVVGEGAQPGWTSAPLPVGTALRLRVEGAARLSEGVVADRSRGPGELARLDAGEGTLRGLEVGQIVRGPSGILASTLGGGLIAVEQGQVRGVGRWEGLPDEEVIALAAEGETVLVGTAAGAALLRAGQVVRVWDEELLHPRVQAVALEGERRWLGSYQGLQRVEGEVITSPLEPWSVFSLRAAAGGGVWVGYDGLRRVDSAGMQLGEALLAGERLFDIALWGEELLVASEQSGLRRLRAGEEGLSLSPAEEVGAYSLAWTTEGLWVARGEAGLWGPDGRRRGRAQGLPGDSAWSLLAEGPRLWVGSEAGLGWLSEDGAPGGSLPVAPWPAGLPVSLMLASREGAFVGGPTGLGSWGRPHRQAADLLAASRPPMVALLDDGEGGIWAIGDRAAHLDRRGRLRSLELPGPVRAAVLHQGALWVASEAAVWNLGAGSPRWPGLEVQALASHDSGLLLLSRGSVLRASASVLRASASVLRANSEDLRPFVRPREVLSMAVDPSSPDALWLGTVSGLERLTLVGPEEGAVEELGGAGRLLAIAADGEGGCWMVDEEGRVSHWSERGLVVVHEPSEFAPRPTGLVVDPWRPTQAVFLLTEAGVYRLSAAASGPGAGR